MKKNATTKEQRDEIERRIDIASHKTKSAAAAYNGDWQMAFQELVFAYDKQRHY